MAAMVAAARSRVFNALILVLLGCGGSTTLADDRADREPAEPERTPPAPGTVDPVGTWYDCRQVVRFDSDGTFSLDADSGCFATGSWSAEGDVLDWEATSISSECGWIPAVGEVRAMRVDNALVLHHNEYVHGVLPFMDETTPRANWRIEGTMEDVPGVIGVNIARIIGTPRDGYSSACYWAPDENSNGLMSNTGWIEIWEERDGEFTAKTSCSGGCACGAVLTGTPQPDGTITGHYNAANCARLFGGDFTMTPAAE